MRVYPVNLTRTENLSCRKPTNNIGFKSANAFLPTNMGESFVLGALFTVIVSAIYYLGFKILNNAEAYMKDLSDEAKKAEEKETSKQ